MVDDLFQFDNLFGRFSFHTFSTHPFCPKKTDHKKFPRIETLSPLSIQLGLLMNKLQKRREQSMNNEHFTVKLLENVKDN